MAVSCIDGSNLSSRGEEAICPLNNIDAYLLPSFGTTSLSEDIELDLRL